MEPTPAWSRPLAWCLHAVGLLLGLAPLLDLAAGVGSLNPGAVPWRFGAAGLLSGALVLPLLGLALILAASVLLEQTGVTRTIAVLAVLIVVAVLGITVVFGLDALQVRAQIPQQAKRAFDLATLKALLTYALEAMVLITLAINAFRAARSGTEHRSARKGGTIVVGRGDS